ncbi:5-METHYLTETRAHYDROPTEROYLTRIGLUTAMATE--HOMOCYSTEINE METHYLTRANSFERASE [Salix koriyanagi]|uniref:5-METHYLTETRAHYDROPTEROYLTRIGLUTAMATE--HOMOCYSTEINE METHYLTRANSFERASE n=1 Tax=Salix koriyanagi TaxID=2511006 RepID=A0A9Q1A8H2_9ROSI|nr:5-METHYLTETRAHYDROPTEROYLTRIGLUTAMATE--HOMOCYSTEINE METHYLTRANSFERASE [Salix koriyanagi]
MASHVVGYPHIGDLEKVAADLSKSNDHFIDAEWVPDVKLPYAFYKAGREYMEAKASRKSSPGVTYEAVQKAAAALKGSDHRRATNVSARLDAQQKKLNFHLLPTSIIGSFPQTMELRKVRREYKAKKISEDDYVKAIEEEIREFVEFQEELGINVLVHGEPERNDMVEYFGKVPSTEEIADGINKMLAVLETIQVHPDCGLKNKILRSQLVNAK